MWRPNGVHAHQIGWPYPFCRPTQETYRACNRRGFQNTMIGEPFRFVLARQLFGGRLIMLRVIFPDHDGTRLFIVPCLSGWLR